MHRFSTQDDQTLSRHGAPQTQPVTMLDQGALLDGRWGNKDKPGFFEGRWNQTPWHLAAKYRHEAVVELMLGPKAENG